MRIGGRGMRRYLAVVLTAATLATTGLLLYARLTASEDVSTRAKRSPA